MDAEDAVGILGKKVSKATLRLTATHHPREPMKMCREKRMSEALMELPFGRGLNGLRGLVTGDVGSYGRKKKQ